MTDNIQHLLTNKGQMLTNIGSGVRDNLAANFSGQSFGHVGAQAMRPATFSAGVTINLLWLPLLLYIIHLFRDKNTCRNKPTKAAFVIAIALLAYQLMQPMIPAGAISVSIGWFVLILLFIILAAVGIAKCKASREKRYLTASMSVFLGMSTIAQQAALVLGQLGTIAMWKHISLMVKN